MIMVYWRYKAEPGEGREGMYMDWEKVTVTEVTAVRTIHFTKGAPIEVKERKHWGLAFTDDGELTYRHRGRETRFGAGSAVLLPRGQSYTILRHKEGDFHVIDFDGSGISADTVQLFPDRNTKTLQGEIRYLKTLALSGDDLLALGMAPGPKVGNLLNEVLEQVAEGALPNERQALLAYAASRV